MVRRDVLILIAGCALCAGPAGAATWPGNQGRTWAEIAKLPEVNGLYELARGAGIPRDGERDIKPTLTPKAAAALAAYKTHPAEDTQKSNCLPPGMPDIMYQPYPIQVLLTPGQVTIIQEAHMQVRHVYTDGRGHPADPDLTFNGDSIGHWEGDTLVVDTVGFAPEAILTEGVGHSKAEHMVERIRLSSPDMLEIRTRVEDPGVLAQPWEYTGRYARHRDWRLEEYECEQNNRNSVDANGKAGIDLEFKKAP